MSRENLETAKAVIRAVGRRDLSALLELSDPEVEWRSFFALFASGEYRGHDGLRRYVSDLDDAFESLRPQIDDMLDAGEVIVAVGRLDYRGRESGVDTGAPAGWIFRFRKGKLLRFRAFSDPAETLEAAGL